MITPASLPKAFYKPHQLEKTVTLSAISRMIPIAFGNLTYNTQVRMIKAM